MFLSMPKEKYLKHLHINTQLSCRRTAPDSNSWSKLLVGHITFFERASLCISDESGSPIPSTLSVLASYCEGVFHTNIMKLFLCLAGKHVPTSGKPENRFLVWGFFCGFFLFFSFPPISKDLHDFPGTPSFVRR